MNLELNLWSKNKFTVFVFLILIIYLLISLFFDFYTLKNHEFPLTTYVILNRKDKYHSLKQCGKQYQDGQCKKHMKSSGLLEIMIRQNQTSAGPNQSSIHQIPRIEAWTYILILWDMALVRIPLADKFWPLYGVITNPASWTW